MTLVLEAPAGLCDATQIEVALLGPVEAKGCDGTIGIGGPKDRAVLAQLALAGGRLVSEASLIDGIWGDEPPERSAKLVQNQVLRLRKAMRSVSDEPVILTGPRGYRLAAQSCTVDVTRAEELIARARSQAASGRHAQASQLLADALAHWQGDPLADLRALPFAAPAAARLSELRWVAIEERVEADLTCGRHQQLVAELYQAVHDAPLRERLWGQLMIALYRSGRQAEALRTFQQLRARLDEELGLRPGQDLTSIEQAIVTGALPRGMPAAPAGDLRVRPTLGERLDLLRSIDVFTDAGDELLAELGRAVVDVKLEAGEPLTREGEAGQEAFVIVSGEASVQIAGQEIAVLGPGEVVGEMALVDGSPRVATVVALTDMHVLVVERTMFAGLLGERSVAARLLGSVVARLRALELP